MLCLSIEERTCKFATYFNNYILKVVKTAKYNVSNKISMTKRNISDIFQTEDDLKLDLMINFYLEN